MSRLKTLKNTFSWFTRSLWILESRHRWKASAKVSLGIPAYYMLEELNNSFFTGFSRIFPIKELSIFSPEEMGLLFGNPEEDWSRESE
jgi:hypothetical protein